RRQRLGRRRARPSRAHRRGAHHHPAPPHRRPAFPAPPRTEPDCPAGPILSCAKPGPPPWDQPPRAGPGPPRRPPPGRRRAALRLAQDDPHAAIAALAPVLDGSAPVPWPTWLDQAFLLEAIARDALGDSRAAASAVERALDLAEPDGLLTMFLLHPAPGLLERHAPHGTAHAALIAATLRLPAGRRSAPPPPGPRPPLEPLSDSELRVLRYLPTNLTGPEIAGELYLSHNTVRTHITHLYAKLGTHTRTDAAPRAPALGLLAPSPPTGQATRPG